MRKETHERKEFYLSPQYIISDKKEKLHINKGALYLGNNDSDDAFFQTAKFNDPMNSKISKSREYFLQNNQEHSFFLKRHLVKVKKTSENTKIINIQNTRQPISEKFLKNEKLPSLSQQKLHNSETIYFFKKPRKNRADSQVLKEYNFKKLFESSQSTARNINCIVSNKSKKSDLKIIVDFAAKEKKNEKKPVLRKIKSVCGKCQMNVVNKLFNFKSSSRKVEQKFEF